MIINYLPGVDLAHPSRTTTELRKRERGKVTIRVVVKTAVSGGARRDMLAEAIAKLLMEGTK